MRSDLLSEATQPIQRRRWLPRALLWLLLLVLFALFLALTWLLVERPDLAGLTRIADQDATDAAAAAAFTGTFAAVDATAQFNQQQGLDLQSTSAALVNVANLISQTETQQAVNVNITSTAVALSNAQEATRAAEAFAATQQALQVIATQAQLEYQATQDALNRSLASITPAGVTDDVYTVQNDFIANVENASTNTLPLSQAWAISSSGALVAQMDNAILLTERNFLGETFLVEAEFVLAQPGSYDLLLGVRGTGQPLLVRMEYREDGQITPRIYRFTNEQPVNSVAVTEADLVANGLAVPLESATVVVRAEAGVDTLNILVNGGSVISTSIGDLGGAAGLRLPQGTQVLRFQVRSGGS